MRPHDGVCNVDARDWARVRPGRGARAAAQSGRPAAQVWLVDPRRQLTMCWGVVCGALRVDADGGQAAHGRVGPGPFGADARDDGSLDQIGQRHWQGPEIFLVIDDSERLPAGFDSPLEPIDQFVQAGADVGLHIIYTRLFGPDSWGLGADPVLRIFGSPPRRC